MQPNFQVTKDSNECAASILNSMSDKNGLILLKERIKSQLSDDEVSMELI